MHKYLTQEEVNNLPENSIVEITWSGGNGPHRYTVIKKCGLPYAKEGTSFIDFVGDQRYHTRVKLIK